MFKLRNITLPATYIILNNSRNYAFKSDLKIKWVRPERIPFYKLEKSGDLQCVPEIDNKEVLLDFRNSKNLATANDTVKKLFTLEFAPKQQQSRLYRHECVSTVKRHKFDIGSPEVNVAKWTGTIRVLQEVIEKFSHDKSLKVNLNEIITRRKKHLKYLRRWDYKRFEWLLEKLNIVYKPHPNDFHKITRKGSLQKLTTNYTNDLKQERLNIYRRQLQKEQPLFLEEKIRVLSFIKNEQRHCGMNNTIIIEDEIKCVMKQLQDLKTKRKPN